MQERTFGPISRLAWPDHAELGQAIASLEDERRLILSLFYLESLTLEQIATVLDVPEDEVAGEFYLAVEEVGMIPTRGRIAA